MRAVAIADVHLGFQGAGRIVEGRNQRELDVEQAWMAAVENAVAQDPDLVTIAGDVLHHPRVSMHAVHAYRRGIERLSKAGIPVVIAQGNHDAARTAGTLSPLHIPDDYPGVYVVTEPTRIPLVAKSTSERVSVAVFPFVSLGTGQAYRVEPDPAADVNILVVHAAVRGDAAGDALPYFYGSEEQALDVGREADRWDAICLGDFHEFRRLHPTALVFYSGSVERTSSNIWPETQPKGVVAYDTATRELRFLDHATRPVFDYDLGDFASNADYEVGQQDDSRGVNYALEQIAGLPLHADAIVRLQVTDFPRDQRELIDWRLVRELKARCCHFLLDLRLAARGLEAAADRRLTARRTIEEEAEAYLVEQEPAVRDLALSFLAATLAEAPAQEAAA
jgi:DNA repair exonuclease SbcCD nuclease subunit